MSDPDANPDLIFQWFVHEGRGWKLMLVLLAVTLFVSGFLLLFQVVYPATKHQRLTPQRVLILDLASPAARQVVNAISDRDFLVLRNSATAVTPASVRAPVFEPTFKDFNYRVRDFLETSNAAAPLPRLFQPDQAPLPPLAAAASHARPKSMAQQSLRAVVVEGLQQRPLLKSVTVDDADAEGFKMRVAVAKDGRITSVVPLAGSSAQMTLFARLQPMLDSVRFAPAAPAAAVEWGTLSFQWRRDVKR